MPDAALAFGKLFTDWKIFSDPSYFASFVSFFELDWFKVAAVSGLLVVFFLCGRLLPALDADVGGNATARRVVKYALYSILIALTVASFIYLKCIDVDSSFIYFQF